MLPGKRFIAQIHSCQLQKCRRFFFCVCTATDVSVVMFLLAAIICGIHYLMTLKTSSEMCFGKISK